MGKGGGSLDGENQRFSYFHKFRSQQRRHLEVVKSRIDSEWACVVFAT